MILKKEAFEYISQISNSVNYETGGIIGGTENGTVTDVVPDIPVDTPNSKFEYFPNVTFFNKEIEKWERKNIKFMGIFHTHFNGSRSLSAADEKYIKTIMLTLEGITEYLYFPVFTVGDNVFTVYKAHLVDGKLIIYEEESVTV